MANTLTPEQFEQACKNAIVSVEKNISKILINTTNIGSADMQSRIFDEGKTVAGNTMRYRSNAYKKLRVDAGLGVNYKDLTFTGNLFYSMSILNTAQNEVVYGFNNAGTAQIAEWQETSDKQVNEPIFQLTDKEAKLMERQFAIDVAKVFKGALENFPNMPSPAVLKDPSDAIEKAQRRNRQKKQKQKAFAKRQKQKEAIKAGKVVKPKQNRLDIQKKKLIKTDLKTSAIIKKKEALQKELSTKQKQINAKQKELDKKNLQKFKTRKEYLNGYIGKKQTQADIYALKLSKAKPGSKSGAEYSRKYIQAKRDIVKARKELYESKFTKGDRKENPVQKKLSAQKRKLAQSRASYKTQSTKYKQDKRTSSQKLRDQQRKTRAKQLRMGTYKPKKRK
jgi:hypothetical protein